MNRTIPIDLLRGLIMAFMALDHASAMVGRVHFAEMWGVHFKPYMNEAWLFTRFISHLCAPGFFFLMGISMVLFAHKRQLSHWTNRAIRTYFMKRAGIIMLCMFLLELPAWGLSMYFNQKNTPPEALPGTGLDSILFPSTVLYGLAAAMFVGAFLWKWNKWLYPIITAACFAFSTAYIMQADPTQAFAPYQHLLFVPGASDGVIVVYPLIPWLGIATFGMFIGKIMIAQGAKAYNFALKLGLLLIASFFALRFMEWGNFHKNAYDSLIDFFTLIKYPPSLVFFTITCGINLVLLYLFSKISDRKWLHLIRIFGQTAMFFYLAHLYFYALAGAFFPLGTSIGIMYIVWLIGLLALYFICNAFLKFKSKKAANSLWRMI